MSGAGWWLLSSGWTIAVGSGSGNTAVTAADIVDHLTDPQTAANNVAISLGSVGNNLVISLGSFSDITGIM